MDKRLVNSNDTVITDEDGMVYVFCEEFTTVIGSDLKMLEERLTMTSNRLEKKYKPYGGKWGYLNSLRNFLVKESRYFDEKGGNFVGESERHQNFIECAIEYEVTKSVITGIPLTVVEPDSLEGHIVF